MLVVRGKDGSERMLSKQEMDKLIADGQSYQAGVFYAYETCGLGYRKGGLILNNYSKFVGHVID